MYLSEYEMRILLTFRNQHKFWSVDRCCKQAHLLHQRFFSSNGLAGWGEIAKELELSVVNVQVAGRKALDELRRPGIHHALSQFGITADSDHPFARAIYYDEDQRARRKRPS